METISLSELLEMPSRDAEGYGGNKVRDLLNLKRSDEFYPELVESMRKHGMKSPVMIIDGVFRNGHHRVAAALDLGMTEIWYTSNEVLGESEEWPNGQAPESWCWDEDDSPTA